MSFARTTTLLFSLLLLGGAVLGANELRIHNTSEFIDFSDNVNSGTSYSGTTIYLDSDIAFDSSLSQQFEPIGSSTSYFQGTFDGQGHTISGLTLNSSSEYVGLFGYSNGAVVKNVVLDESCSFVSSSCSNDPNLGSIVGYCTSCAIERIVNMARVTFTGNTPYNICAGGFVGRFLGSSTIKNCVNYGPVTHSGYSKNEARIGGIMGMCGGKGSKNTQNCANYGTITHNGESKNLYMGGIVGTSWFGTTRIENCVSAGQIVNSTQGSKDNYVGSVAGYINTETNIIHCLWTSDVGYNDIYDPKSTGTKVTVTNSSHKELNTETVDGLNEYAENNSTFSNWFILHLNGGRINNLNQETLIVTQKHFPDPVKEGYTFLFWCKDAKCTERYDSETTDISEITDLYAAWNGTYTITFDFGNGTTMNTTFIFNETIAYPENPTKEGHTFNGWSPRPVRMPAKDITVTAQWTEKPSEFVEIVFGKKDLEEEQVKEILQVYTKEEYTIVNIENDEETGGTKVLLKFVDKKGAENFHKRVIDSSEATNNSIVRLGFIIEPDFSLSSFISPLLLNFIFM